jgi:hypothetical protein
MSKKILIGGVIVGVVLFVWSAVAHMALPIGEMGIKTIQNEDAVLAALKANINEPGFYFFPGNELMQSRSLPKEQQQAAMEAWEKKYAAGPRGIMVYHPTGDTPMHPKQFIREFLANVVGGWIVAFALAMALGRLTSFGARAGFVALLGLLPWVIVDISYWNWFGFPTSYLVAQLLDQAIGMLLAGIALAFLFRKS